MFFVQILLIGAPGVGKTSTKAVILCEDPPIVRISTPLALRDIKVYQIDTSDPTKWVELSRKDRNRYISMAMNYCTFGTISELPEVSDLTKQHQEIEGTNESLDYEEMESSMPTTSIRARDRSLEVSRHVHLAPRPVGKVTQETTTYKELHTLMKESIPGDPVDRISRLQITDSGGQPQFHEILPIFLQGTSLYIFVQKLSEELAAHGIVEYFDKEGKSVCKPYQASCSNMDIFQHCVRVLLSHRLKSRDGNVPHLMIVGTFKDKMDTCVESISDKEKKLQNLLLPTFEKKMIYHSLYPQKRLIHPLNAKTPEKEDKQIAKVIRDLISKKCRAKPIEIPLQWHALESLLEELTESENRGVFSTQECFVQAKKLHFEHESFNAALLFFEKLNVVYYYPQLLPQVVFTNTQVLLDKVTELLVAAHNLKYGENWGPLDCSWQRFHDYALVSVQFLSQKCFSKHFVPSLFESKDLLNLFNGLSIFAKFNDEEYFVPSLLKKLTETELDKYRVKCNSSIPAMTLVFPNGGPCLGVFCASVVFLLSPSNNYPCAWELAMEEDSITPCSLYRNCVKFTIPKPNSDTRQKYPGTVVFMDAFTHFEIHLHLQNSIPNLVTKLCSLITNAVLEANHSANMALHYSISKPNLGLICPCKILETHAAEIDQEIGYLVCTKSSSVNFPLFPEHFVWFEKQVTPSISKPVLGKHHITVVYYTQ